MDKVIIIGAGFGGVAAALEFAKARPHAFEVTVVSDKSHFEYHPALYRVVAGSSPLEVCISLREIFSGKGIGFENDFVTQIDPVRRMASGKSGKFYEYDYAILGLGSETAFFSIPGLETYSYGFKSIREALELNTHIVEQFDDCAGENTGMDKKVCLLHFVIVGAGASGVELAGELAQYAKKLALLHGVDESLITIELIESAPRILPQFSDDVAGRVEKRLRDLGVNIFVNRAMTMEEAESISIRGMKIKTESVIWTAGIKPNRFYASLDFARFDKKGRVLVDDYLRVQGAKGIFVVGDGAATPYSGLAQTALREGALAAQNIMRLSGKKEMKKYIPKKPKYAIPVGHGWAASIIGPVALYGYLGWIVRRAADFGFFYSILPLGKALLAFRSGKRIGSSCSVCADGARAEGAE